MTTSTSRSLRLHEDLERLRARGRGTFSMSNCHDVHEVLGIRHGVHCAYGANAFGIHDDILEGLGRFA